MRAVIELKREADPEQILLHLYKYSDFKSYFGVNTVAIMEETRIVTAGALSTLYPAPAYVVTRRTQYAAGSGAGACTHPRRPDGGGRQSG